MVIAQGDVFWVDFGNPVGSEPGYKRPCVIVQNDAFNKSQIDTVVVVAITSNLRLERAFGNVTLNKGEAGLPKRCVVNISQITTVDQTMLIEKTGSLNQARFAQILQGIYGLLKPIPI